MRDCLIQQRRRVARRTLGRPGDQRQRVIGDYLQPAGIFAEGFHVLSALTDPNDYAGPGTGYRVEGERWER
ncbi:MAG: propanediol/glycerol family dehydratase large subunit, partial [Roseovarius sp.]